MIFAVLIAAGTFWFMYSTPAAMRRAPGVIHAERCGGSFDGVALTTPLVSLFLRDVAMEIRYTSRVIELQYTDIESVRIDRYIAIRALWIFHNRADLPTEIILFCRNNRKVAEIIEQRLGPGGGVTPSFLPVG